MTGVKLQCVFLRDDGNWSSQGITTEFLEDGRVRCISNHLTSFTVLLSAAGVDEVAVS